jgi:hypothetical protein
VRRSFIDQTTFEFAHHSSRISIEIDEIYGNTMERYRRIMFERLASLLQPVAQPPLPGRAVPGAATSSAISGADLP